MKNYSFCILNKKNNLYKITECENKINNKFIKIDLNRKINSNINEYIFEKAIYDSLGIKEYYRDIFWEFENYIILFSDIENNIMDFCKEVDNIFNIKLVLKRISIQKILNIENKKEIVVNKVQKVEDVDIEKRKLDGIKGICKYINVEILMKLEDLTTFIEIVKERIVRLTYSINELQFINIIKRFEEIDGEFSN